MEKQDLAWLCPGSLAIPHISIALGAGPYSLDKHVLILFLDKTINNVKPDLISLAYT
jgi:hypothetical protein